MSEKHSIANKKRWAKVSKKKKSEEMSNRRKKGWAKKTKKQLKAEGARLAKARKNKAEVV